MGSTSILKVRICLKSLQPFFHQGRPAFSRTFLWNPSQPSPSPRFLCTRDNNPKLSGRKTDRGKTGQADGQGGMKNGSIRREKQVLWYDELEEIGRGTSVQRRPSFPKSVFAAGTAKRMAHMLKMKASLSSVDEAQHKDESDQRAARSESTVKLQVPDRPLPAAEWKKLKESLGNHQRFEIQMMHTMFSSGADLDIAKSLLTFVAMETGTLSYELLLRYLMLCVSGGHDAEAFDIYEIMLRSFPSLDSGAASLFIKSFTRTDRWREALVILRELKQVFTLSPRNYGDIIAAAVLHRDMVTAWALYDELIEKGLTPNQDTWGVLFKGPSEIKEEEGEGTEAVSQAEHQERLLNILLHMRNNQIYPEYSLASSIKTWFESLAGQAWTGRWTIATPKGVCQCCGSNLESIQLTTEEYQQLKDRVMADIIQGKDVFRKTNPEELKRFKTFVKRKPAFDVVVDGLNVANITKDRAKRSETLLAVVSELERQGLTVLVLGRKHMLQPSRSWDRHNMNLIQQKAHCFFTDNISEDDPFLLYATLHSGNHCRFVSRDLMRDHKACLPDRATRRLFFKWQRGHQMVVDGHVAAGRRVRFQSIPSYDTIVQTSGDSWHIPYDDTEDRSTHEVPQRWLCLTKKH
ncbi:mitochondrial ribonuclease P catalytic subunit [Mugil cephalus]|uniref:mitochondrial ribonuclease P catalytic subunit n=1 Tax=Mugil cephalus TaxID=48193 RepID=UPI001FB77B83|nr:mitochondrial ribonuclease P catalytic subunit [Mugil cephalus]